MMADDADMTLSELEDSLSCDGLTEPSLCEQGVLVLGLLSLAVVAVYVLCLLLAQGASDVLEIVTLVSGNQNSAALPASGVPALP